ARRLHQLDRRRIAERDPVGQRRLHLAAVLVFHVRVAPGSPEGGRGLPGQPGVLTARLRYVFAVSPPPLDIASPAACPALPFPFPDPNAARVPPVMLASMLASSRGTTNFVEGEEPMVFSASRYCRLIVFPSSPLATSKIFDRAIEKPSARRMAAWRSPSAVVMAAC